MTRANDNQGCPPMYPHDHLRRLTPADWEAFEGGASRPGLCFVLSPLMVPIEVTYGSANHKITVGGATSKRGQISPVLLAEHYANTGDMENLLALLETSPECCAHLIDLPQPFWSHGCRKLFAAQELARSLMARRAALDAIK